MLWLPQTRSWQAAILKEMEHMSVHALKINATAPSLVCYPMGPKDVRWNHQQHL